MKEQIDNVIEWIKQQPVEGCITGSCLLEYFEDQDVDLFTYGEKSFSRVIYAMYHSPMFTILNDLEEWKLNQFMNKSDNTNKFGVLTIKFLYNTCVPVNIILKKNCYNIFSVMASFDLDIICKGYDLKSKQFLDLSQNLPDKGATWNKWNTSYYSGEIWEISRLLRQIIRCIKYHKRGYNTDLAVLRYIEKLDELINFNNLFNSAVFEENLKNTKSAATIIKDICNLWLEKHDLTEKQMELLKEKMLQL